MNEFIQIYLSIVPGINSVTVCIDIIKTVIHDVTNFSFSRKQAVKFA